MVSIFFLCKKMLQGLNNWTKSLASLQIRGSIRGFYKKVNSEKHFQSFILAAVWRADRWGTRATVEAVVTLPQYSMEQGQLLPVVTQQMVMLDSLQGEGQYSHLQCYESCWKKKEEDQDNPKGSGWLPERDNYHLEIESVMKHVKKEQLAMGISRGQF